MNDVPAQIKLPGELSSLAQFSAFARETAIKAGLSEHTAWEIELAVDEAATNVIQHAYTPENRGNVRLICYRETDRFIIMIYDRGMPFDPETVPPPDLVSSIDTREAGGLGLFLINRMMDNVQFTFNPDTGENELRMEKRVETKIPDDVRFIPVHGRIDATGAPALAAIVRDTAEAGIKRIILDFSDVAFLSSSGLRILLMLARELKAEGGELRLCELQPTVAEVFSLTGFDQIFFIHQTQQDVLSALVKRS